MSGARSAESLARPPSGRNPLGHRTMRCSSAPALAPCLIRAGDRPLRRLPRSGGVGGGIAGRVEQWEQVAWLHAQLHVR